MLAYALNALKLGLCVMPATEDGTKQPLGNSLTDRRWKDYQTNLPTEKKIKQWYGDGKLRSIGFVCGAVSGNLEVMDFDDLDCYHAFKTAASTAGIGDLVKKIEEGYLEYSPKGVHWFYRCEQIDKNLKLASREKRATEKQHEKDRIQVMIETRGEGGYIIAAPSSGPVNPNGEYTIISGSLETIQIITPSERNELHRLAKALDQVQKAVVDAFPTTYTDTEGKRPGDDFTERTPWADILEPHGWKRCGAAGEEEFWTRPGKNFGVSASTNYSGSGLFYPWTTSTDFESERGYNKFAVYAYLNHAGDFEEAAIALSSKGYGGTLVDDLEEFTDEVKKLHLKKKSIEYTNSIPDDLMNVPGVINEMRSYLNQCAIRPQPIFEFAASLAFAGLLMARRVQTQTGLRTNLFIISLGGSACGKNEARNRIRQALIDADCKNLIGAETIGSESGLIEELGRQGGHCIYQLDEIGYALEAMTNKRAASYLSNIIPTLMKLQSSAGRPWIGKSLKITRDAPTRIDIDDPCVIVYATSVPEKYFKAIDYSNIEDGFVPRFLIFQTDNQFPRTNYQCYTGRTPQYIIDHIHSWIDDPRSGAMVRVQPEARKVPHSKESARIMMAFEDVVQRQFLYYSAQRLNSIWGRAQSTAEQLALLFTCSQNPQAETINSEMADKACKLTRHMCEQQMVRLDCNISSNQYESEIKEVMAVIRGTRGVGITRTELRKKFMGIDAKKLNSVLDHLEESELIKVYKEKKDGSQKPSRMYVANSSLCNEP